jgi:hypothetical protein
MRPMVVSALKFGAVDPKRRLDMAGQALVMVVQMLNGVWGKHGRTYGGALGASDMLGC